MTREVDVAIESAKRTFATAVDWPGWSRAGRNEEAALDALRAAAGRYAAVAREAGLAFPDPDGVTFAVVERAAGGGGTDFGVPSRVTDRDRRPTGDDEADRLARLVAAAWATFDRIAAAAPPELRKGPRGGGRDRDGIIAHVVGADHAYAREIGLRLPPPEPGDARAVSAIRSALLEVLRRPSDGSPIADRRWTRRYAAHRIGWHALDHAWEIADRSEPAAG